MELQKPFKTGFKLGLGLIAANALVVIITTAIAVGGLVVVLGSNVLSLLSLLN